MISNVCKAGDDTVEIVAGQQDYSFNAKTTSGSNIAANVKNSDTSLYYESDSTDTFQWLRIDFMYERSIRGVYVATEQSIMTGGRI